MLTKDICVRYSFYLSFLLLFGGCATHQTDKSIFQNKKTVVQKEYVADIKELPQSIEPYLSNLQETHFIGSLQEYEKAYFKPWNIEKIDITLDEARWAYQIFTPKNSYGVNLLPLTQEYFLDIEEKSNFEDFATLNKTAITVVHTDMRAFPSEKPLFLNPDKAGEGFPFDYLQNSSIAPNKPLLVSHYSKDKEWVFVESSFTYGWIKARDMVFMPKKYIKSYQNAQKVFVQKENIPLYDKKNNFLFRTQIGMLLPIVDMRKKEQKTPVLLISNYKNQESFYITNYIENYIVKKGVLEFNQKNIKDIFHEVSQVKYGWGGMYVNRDCSSILRDFFAPFGIWLPRNSSKQRQIGEVISLKNLTDEAKLQKIKNKAIPFETLLYKKGHILLYVGIQDGKVVVFHNTWGVKTQKDGEEGRFIIGKPIFSTLEVGSNLKDYDKNASILHKLESMNIITKRK